MNEDMLKFHSTFSIFISITHCTTKDGWITGYSIHFLLLLLFFFLYLIDEVWTKTSYILITPFHYLIYSLTGHSIKGQII